jgi:hypothetical protein
MLSVDGHGVGLMWRCAWCVETSFMDKKGGVWKRYAIFILLLFLEVLEVLRHLHYL